MTQICHFSHIHDAYQKGHIYITKGKYHFSNSFLKIKQKYQLHVNPLVVLTYDSILRLTTNMFINRNMKKELQYFPQLTFSPFLINHAVLLTPFSVQG